MFYLVGVPENLKTLIALSKSVNSLARVDSLQALKASLNQFLKTIQPEDTISQADRPQFVRSRENIEDVLSLFQEQSRLNDIQQQSVIRLGSISDGELDWVQSSAFSAMARISALDPHFAQLLNVVVNFLFTAGSRKAGGGSSSAAIGCVWMNPRKRWTEQDFCEFLVHETTHQLMFFDELRYRHYSDSKDLEREENFAYSSILNRQRPLDKVLHSLIVAHDVLAFRKRFFDPLEKTFLHPDSKIMEQSILKTVASLRSLDKKLMTDRAWALIDLVGTSGISRVAI
jgi:hypothetical protein